MHLATKVVYTFNKFYGNFLRDAKNDEGIKKVIKENYKVIVKVSPDYINFFWSELKPYVSNIDPSNENVMNACVFKGVKVADVVSKLGELSESNVVTVWNYIYILSALAIVYDNIPEKTVTTEQNTTETVTVDDKETDEEPRLEPIEEATSEDEVMFEKIIKVFGMVQRGDDAFSELTEILDDDLRNVLSKISKPNVATDDKDDLMSMFSTIENSKICNLAKEISSEIDVSNLKIESPQDVMKLMDFSGSNNVLGNIIGKVSTKIQEKISTGEIKHEDLLGEAMSMMSLMNKGGASGLGGLGGLSGLFNNPMMGEMMKNMKKGNVAAKTDILKRESTRDKLRKKLEERKKGKDS